MTRVSTELRDTRSVCPWGTPTGSSTAARAPPRLGRIVFEGTPADLVAARATLTGEHLGAYVSTRARPSRRP
jgi:hypothetical protein